MTDRVVLDWRQPMDCIFVASCGEDQQGEARVAPSRGGWGWSLDMLPYDSEPVVRGWAETREAAQMAVERQAAIWPGLIEGAARDG